MKAENQFKLEYYTDDQGKCLFLDWLKGLKNEKAASRILADLTKVEMGIFNNLKSLGQGLHELRLFYGPGYRAYLFFKNGKIIVVLAGGDKSTQERDIKKAMKLMEGAKK
jgi:putative addiction module killer protein